MYAEASPLHGACVEVVIFNMQIPRGHCLAPQTIEQGHLSSAGYAHCMNVC